MCNGLETSEERSAWDLLEMALTDVLIRKGKVESVKNKYSYGRVMLLGKKNKNKTKKTSNFKNT